MPKCTHKHLRFTSTEWEDGYRQPDRKVIQEALKVPERMTRTDAEKADRGVALDAQQPNVTLAANHTFPAPLVEEDDELYHHPNYRPQSVEKCVQARNAVTEKRRTVYVVPPPQIADDVVFMRGWSLPRQPAGSRKRKTPASDADAGARDNAATEAPQVEDVAEYLEAFYCGLPVKVLDRDQLKFVHWSEGKEATGEPSERGRIGLATGREVFAVRHRPSRDGIFTNQLNLKDLLHTAMAILPSDAYALLMLVHEDLYEDEDDEFCCGRAYGGSRIAVVTTARYRPELDRKQDIDREHAWPASHCVMASDWSRLAHGEDKTKRRAFAGSAMASAVDVFNSLPSPTTMSELAALWLGRVCKTASHELGHCFGMGHCKYFACIMQGTANIAEDARQPAYLCPVDLVKVLTATGASETEHCEALLRFCERRAADRLFAALAAWLCARLRQIAASA